MRHTSVAVAVFVALLNASWMPCSPVRASDQPITAVRILSDYLVATEETSDLVKNMAAAQKYLSEPQTNPEVVELVELFVKLDPKLDSAHICEAESIANKWNIVKAIEKRDLEASEMMRLEHLVSELLPSRMQACFRLFEEKWLKEKNEIERELNAIENLTKELEIADSSYAPAKGCTLPNCRPEADSLLNSLNIYLGGFKVRFGAATPDQTAALPAQTDLLSKHENQARNSVKNMIEGNTYPSEDELKAKYKEIKFEPCEKFVAHQQSKAILEPVGQLADLFRSSLMTIQPVKGDKISTFEWASRYYHCKMYQETGLDEFTKNIWNFLERIRIEIIEANKVAPVKAVDAPSSASWFGNLFSLGNIFRRSAEQPTASEHAAEEVNEQSTNVA